VELPQAHCGTIAITHTHTHTYIHTRAHTHTHKQTENCRPPGNSSLSLSHTHTHTDRHTHTHTPGHWADSVIRQPLVYTLLLCCFTITWVLVYVCVCGGGGYVCIICNLRSFYFHSHSSCFRSAHLPLVVSGGITHWRDAAPADCCYWWFTHCHWSSSYSLVSVGSPLNSPPADTVYGAGPQDTTMTINHRSKVRGLDGSMSDL